MSEDGSEEIREPDTNGIKRIIEEEMNANIIPFPPNLPEIPKKTDFSRFGKNADIAEETYNVFLNFVNLPIIVDNYATHEEREKARFKIFKELETKYGRKTADMFNKIVTDNKLKRNKIAQVAMAANLFIDFIGNTPSLKEIQDIINKEVKIQTEKDPKTGREVYDPWSEKSKTVKEKEKVLSNLTNLIIKALEEIRNWENTNKEPKRDPS